AALIFSGPLSPWLAYGVAATFVTSAISALVLAIRSSLPFVIAGPDAPTATVTATLAAALASRIVANGGPDDLFAPVLLVVAVSAILSGVLLCVIGVSWLECSEKSATSSFPIKPCSETATNIFSPISI